MGLPTNAPEIAIVTMVFRNKFRRVATCEMIYTPPAPGPVVAFADIQTAINDFHDGFGGEVDDLMDVESELSQCRARYVTNEGAELICHSAGAAIAGAKGGTLEDPGNELEGLPPQTALCVHKVTGYGGRQNRGRLFLPFISEAVQNDGVIDTLNRIAVQQTMTRLKTGFSVLGTQWLPSLWNLKDNIVKEIIRFEAAEQLSTRVDRRYKGIGTVISEA